MVFDSYPHKGRALLGKVVGSNCRHRYGLNFMKITGQTKCAYCGQDFPASYENWLQMALDHVVPKSVCASFDLPTEWIEDCTNEVLACAACNGFNNRYRPASDVPRPSSLQEFSIFEIESSKSAKGRSARNMGRNVSSSTASVGGN